MKIITKLRELSRGERWAKLWGRLGNLPVIADFGLAGKTVAGFVVNQQRRHYWVAAFPALAALAAGLGLVLFLWLRPAEQARLRLERVSEEALAAGDYRRALIASLRLVRSQTAPDPTNLLRLARSRAGLGQKEEAMSLALLLAPPNAVGFAPAQLFIAQTILGDANASPADVLLAEQRLQVLLAAQPQCDEALAMLGQCYYLTEQWSEAKRWLLQAAPKHPEVALMLSVVSRYLKEPEEAQRWAHAAAAHFRLETRNNLRSRKARMRWAEAELIQGHTDYALAILLKGIPHNGQLAFREMASRILTDEVLRLAQNAPAQKAERMILIQQGLGYEPQNTTLVRQLLRLERGEGAEAKVAADFLRTFAADRDNRAVVSYCRGMEAWARGDLPNARDWLFSAHGLAPANLVYANNYAWMLAISEPRMPERGLDLINQIVLRNPNSPIFRETRGELLIQLSRWTEALPDLEFALPYFQRNPQFHANLATVYQRLGLKELSEKHWQLCQAHSPRKPE